MRKAILSIFILFTSISAVCQSVLSSGTWYRLSADRDGIYRISYQKIRQLGIPNPEKARIFGHPRGMLPLICRPGSGEDLRECPTIHRGGYIYFFARSANGQKFSNDLGINVIEQNIYTDRSSYFITGIQTGTPSDMPAESPVPATKTISEGLFTYHHEEMINNLQMSGRRWFGEHFYMSGTERIKFSCNSAPTGKVRISACVAARSSQPEFFTISTGAADTTINLSRVYEGGLYADVRTATFDMAASASENQTLEVSFRKLSPGAVGYLDYITMQTCEPLIYRKKQLIFEINNSTGETAEIRIANLTAKHIVMDVTDDGPTLMSPAEGCFSAARNGRRRYCVTSESDAMEPAYEGIVPNQNIHGLSGIEYLIVTPEIFYPYALEIAGLHPDLKTAVATDQQIYNEFSSGMRDPAAIRDCARHLYKKDGRLRYLLLLGDGSVDNRHNTPKNTNLLPTYQSESSLNENGIQSFVSDDFYGLLEDGEGEYSGTLDIGVGRIPVKNEEEAATAAAKLRTYLSADTHSQWRQKMLLVADDENNGIHMRQSETISGIISENRPEIDISKVYIDAYQQESTSAGDTYPGATRDIIRSLEDGVLLFNYVGHGGMRFFADERILCNYHIDSLKNSRNLPIVITASCNIGRFDNYDAVTGTYEDSPAEHFMNNAHGGAIALLTTTREVSSISNHVLNCHIIEELAKPGARLGDVIRNSKNLTTGDMNKLNFILLGDPAIPISLPGYGISIESINGSTPDTLHAMQSYTVKCKIDPEDNFIGGNAFILIRDKLETRRTLNNDGEGIFEFADYGKILYRGRCTVSGGRFEFTFVMPKDINYTPGAIKISMYAADGKNHSAGYCNNLILSGSAETQNSDNSGPQIALAMESTAEGQILRITLTDDSGINITGTPGHQICLYTDGGEIPVDITPMYMPKSDSHTSGEIAYQLGNLAEGVHTIRVKAWDNMNNASERGITVAVGCNPELGIYNLRNYPNPMAGSTTVSFAHNAQGTVKYTLRIMDGLGRSMGAVSGELAGGEGAIQLTANNLPGLRSGICIYVLEISDSMGRTARDSKKLLILR